MRGGAEWLNIYLTVTEIVKDLRIAPGLTAASSERERETLYSVARKKSLLGYIGERAVIDLIMNTRGHLFKKIKIDHKSI